MMQYTVQKIMQSMIHYFVTAYDGGHDAMMTQYMIQYIHVAVHDTFTMAAVHDTYPGIVHGRVYYAHMMQQIDTEHDAVQ
jgi:hypothetical protein